jgi:hypothetical protein
MAGRDDQRRFGIGDEIAQLRRRIGRVERDIDKPGTQGGEVEQRPLDRFLGLDDDPVAGPRTPCDERRRIACDGAVKFLVAKPDLAAFDEGGRIARFGRRGGDQLVETGAQSAALS